MRWTKTTSIINTTGMVIFAIMAFIFVTVAFLTKPDTNQNLGPATIEEPLE